MAGEGWHLDRRIPITIIVAIVLQSLALGWGASSFNSRLEHVEKTQQEDKIKQLADKVKQLASDRRQWDQIRHTDASVQGLAEAIAGMTSSMKNVERDVGRIFTILDKRRDFIEPSPRR